MGIGVVSFGRFRLRLFRFVERNKKFGKSKENEKEEKKNTQRKTSKTNHLGRLDHCRCSLCNSFGSFNSWCYTSRCTIRNSILFETEYATFEEFFRKKTI